MIGSTDWQTRPRRVLPFSEPLSAGPDRPVSAWPHDGRVTKRAPVPAWRPEEFGGVPGSPEVSTWHVQPEWPLRITHADIYRDGGTGLMHVQDATGRQWAFCFDKFLGRLCTGAHPSDDDAAFVRPGSPLEADLFKLMEETVEQVHRERSTAPVRFNPDGLDRLPHIYRQAVAHSGRALRPSDGA